MHILEGVVHVPAGLEAELLYCIVSCSHMCVATVYVCSLADSLHDSQRRACYGYYIGDEVNWNTAMAAPIGTVDQPLTESRDTDN